MRQQRDTDNPFDSDNPPTLSDENAAKFLVMVDVVSAGQKAMVARAMELDTLGLGMAVAAMARVLNALADVTHHQNATPAEKRAMVHARADETRAVAKTVTADERLEAYVMIESLESVCASAKETIAGVMLVQQDPHAISVIGLSKLLHMMAGAKELAKKKQQEQQPSSAPGAVARAIDELLNPKKG
jgi:hypothetical protein